MIACAPARKNVVIYDKCEKPGLIEGSNIETITLGKNTNDWYVNSLDRSFIGVMPNLKKIMVKKGNERYFTRDGVLFMRSGDGSNNGICLVKYPSSVQAGHRTGIPGMLLYVPGPTQLRTGTQLKMDWFGRSCHNL